MDFISIVLLDTLNRFLGAATLCALVYAGCRCIAAGMAHDVMTEASRYDTTNKEEKTAIYNAKMKHVFSAVTLLLAVLSTFMITPGSDSLIKAKLTAEAAKVLTADTAEKVAEEVLKRVDKALEIADKK